MWILLFLFAGNALAQNPIIRNQFSADPSARVFNGRIYLYPSHDIVVTKGHGRVGWFCMEDYHVFSSSDLTNWSDHGVIISQDSVSWVKPESYSMWAPDCIFRNGKYYFYFPAPPKDSSYGRGFAIGVAISNEPYGPFVPQPEPIKDVHGIDPDILIDRDGQPYLVWAARNIYIAKLNKNMLELASKPKVIEGLPDKGLKEGPYMFERNGIYYLAYPHVQENTERLEYAVSKSPMGPFKVTGVIMDATPDCWTNQCSIIKYQGQWFLFYHRNDLSPHFDKNRSVRIDSLFFNPDGTIKKVNPSLRGVGLTEASAKIQIDRYSLKSDHGTSIAFLDTSNTFKGWKTIFNATNAWIQYNGVQFRSNKLKSVGVKARSKTGGILEIRLDRIDGPVVGQLRIPQSTNWKMIQAPLAKLQTGIHNLIVRLKAGQNAEIDWVSFK